MTPEFAVALAAIALLVAVVGLGLWRAQSTQLQRLLREIETLDKAIAIHSDAASGVGARLLAIEKQLQSLQQFSAEGANKSLDSAHKQALAMLASGEPIEVIAKQSSLSEAEVKLLQLMQGSASD
jgi:hypothetical protein